MPTITTNATHGYDTIEEYRNLRLVEVYPNEGQRPASRFYIVRYDASKGQVFSYLRADRPKDANAEAWCASGLRPASIAYVANPMTEEKAREQWEGIVQQLKREFGE